MVKNKSNIGWWILGLVLVFAIGILIGKYLINQEVFLAPSFRGEIPSGPAPCPSGDLGDCASYEDDGANCGHCDRSGGRCRYGQCMIIGNFMGCVRGCGDTCSAMPS